MLRVRMMTSLRDALDEAAKKENKTASEFVRELVEKRLGLR
jgi:predicted DNA-binding protein